MWAHGAPQCVQGALWDGLTEQLSTVVDFPAALLPCLLAATQVALPSLKWDHKFTNHQVELAKGMLKAVGSIAHPWRSEARMARSHLAGPHLPLDEFNEAHNLLGMLAGRCQWLVQHANGGHVEPMHAFLTLLGDMMPAIMVCVGMCATCDISSAPPGLPPPTSATSHAAGQWRPWSWGGGRWAATAGHIDAVAVSSLPTIVSPGSSVAGPTTCAPITTGRNGGRQTTT